MKNKVVFYKVSHRRGRGRPRKVALKKTEQAEQMTRLQKSKLKNDDLFNSLLRDPDDPTSMDKILHELAREAVILDVARTGALNKDEDTSAITSKRVATLKTMGDFWFKKRDILLSDQLDFKSKAFSKLYEFFLEKVAETLEASGMSSEEQAHVFQTLAASLEGWEKEAEAFVYASTKKPTQGASDDND